MPKFSINVRTESHIASTVMVESKDLAALRVEIAKYVGELLTDHAAQIWTDEDWRIDATDESGLILFVLHVSASATAATMHSRS